MKEKADLKKCQDQYDSLELSDKDLKQPSYKCFSEQTQYAEKQIKILNNKVKSIKKKSEQP